MVSFCFGEISQQKPLQLVGQTGPTPGSHGHPYVCRRPCILFIHQKCDKAKGSASGEPAGTPWVLWREDFCKRVRKVTTVRPHAKKIENMSQGFHRGFKELWYCSSARSTLKRHEKTLAGCWLWLLPHGSCQAHFLQQEGPGDACNVAHSDVACRLIAMSLV